MWTRIDFKKNGKQAFMNGYWVCVLTCLIMGIASGSLLTRFADFLLPNMQELEARTMELSQLIQMNGQIPAQLVAEWLVMYMEYFMVVIGTSLVFTTLLGNVVQVGACRVFLENREHSTEIGKVLYGFQNRRYGKTVGVMFLKGLKESLWSLLFLIPGFVKRYEYRMVPYLLAENPTLSQRRIFQLSREMMQGHKMEAFIMDLSFIGWMILGSFTYGVSDLMFTNPYREAAFAEFYSARKAETYAKGGFAYSELPGFGEEAC